MVRPLSSVILVLVSMDESGVEILMYSFTVRHDAPGRPDEAQSPLSSASAQPRQVGPGL